MSDSRSQAGEPDLDQTITVEPILDTATGLNPVVGSALRHYSAIKDSFITLMKRNAKSLSHESWNNLNKNIDQFGDALTLLSMEVAHLQGKIDQLQAQREREVPQTYASVLATRSEAHPRTTAPAETAAGSEIPPESNIESNIEPRETLLVFGENPEVNTWRALTSSFNPVDLNIQNVSIRNIRSNGVCVQASNRDGPLLKKPA